MKLKKRIIIELTPAAIDGAVIRMGRVVRTSRVDLEQTDWRQAWEEGLSQFDSKLSAIIETLEAPGAVVDVAYRSPSSFAEVITVPVTGSAVESAAKLSLADHVGFDLQMNPYGISPITTTKAKGSRKTHTLAIADQSSVSETLSAWLGRAGCHLASAFPASAMILGDAIEEARKDRGDAVSTCLYVGQHSALLTVFSDGAIRMVRRIEIGFEDFVTAITRPIIRHRPQSETDTEDSSLLLTPEMARVILCNSGIPDFQGTVDSTLGLMGKDILPLVQPALQRMAIEIKQSLRFELSTDERESIQLKLSGPFGSMPNLASSICKQIEIHADHCGTGSLDRSIVEEPFQGDSGRAIRLSRLSRSHSLVSNKITSLQRMDSFRIGIRAGAVAASVAMVSTAFFLNSQIQNELLSTRNLGAAMASVEEIISINESILIRSNTLSETQRRIGSAIGLTMRWSDVMSVLPGLVPESVSLNEIEGTERTGQDLPKIILTGIAQATEEQSCHQALNVFIESLNTCPLIASVDLGVTNRVQGGSMTESMRFTVTVNLVATPRVAVVSNHDEVAP